MLLNEDKINSIINDILNEVKINECDLLTESLFDNSLDGIKSKIKKALIAGIAISSILMAINKLAIDIHSKKELIDFTKNEQVMPDKFQTQVNAVRECMAYYLKLNGYKSNASPLSPQIIVRVANENNFDLPLLLAQAQVESNFGMGNRAQRTNSAWSVGLFDNGKNICTYNNMNDSIYGYVDLLKKDYLSVKSIDDLLRNGGFTNKLGKRYAKDKDYEKKVRSTRNAIMQRFPEL